MQSREHNLPIKGFIETSFVDWRGYISSVAFLGGCNFRCPFCHNRELVTGYSQLEDIPIEYIIVTLRRHRNWINNIVVTGGEPLLHKDIYSLIGRLKQEGLAIKLDTNGSFPSVLKGLVNDGLVDYIAMDMKGPVEQYQRWTGVDIETAKIRESIDFILEGTVEYEFRMTVVPFLHTEKDIYRAAEEIREAKRFYIQEFRPVNTLDPSYEHIRPFPADKISAIRANVKEIVSSYAMDQQQTVRRPWIV